MVRTNDQKFCAAFVPVPLLFLEMYGAQILRESLAMEEHGTSSCNRIYKCIGYPVPGFVE